MNELSSRDWLTKEEASAFIGKNTEYYLEKWKNHPDTFYKGWNWAAAIFRVEWMAYRKMYLEAVTVLVIVIVLGGFIDTALGFLNLNVPDEVARFAVQILIGAFANGLYRNKAVRTLRRTSNMDISQRLDFLARKGGTSLVGLFVLLGLEITVVMLPSLIRYIILRS